MSPLNRSLPDDKDSWHLIALGIVLVLSSIALAGWLLARGDVPGGLSTLLLTVAGSLFIVIGNAEASRPSA